MTKFAWRVTFTVCLRRSDTLGEIQVAGHDFGVAIEFAPATQWRHQYSRLFLMDCPITGGTPTACSNTSIDIFPPVRSIQYHPTLWTNSSAHTAAPVRYPMARATTRRGRKTNSTTSARRGRPSASRSMSSPKHPCSAVSSHRSGASRKCHGCGLSNWALDGPRSTRAGPCRNEIRLPARRGLRKSIPLRLGP